MQRSKLAKRARLLFFLAAIAFYFYGLGRLPLLGPDEPRYAEVAREMYLRGDAITPTLGGHTWFEKPPLLYWMMMASFRASGISEASARFGPALCGLLTVLLVYWMTRRVERASDEAETGGLALWTSALTASSAGLIVFSRGATFDIILTLTLTASLASLFVYELEREGRRRRFLLAGFYACIGAALLAKGLVGLILPAGIVGCYFILRRSWPGRGLMKSMLWGLPLAILSAASWYGPVMARHGWTFVDEFFIQHHFARYISDKYHHPQRFYFYLPVMALMALPWTPFLAVALARVRRWQWRVTNASERLRLFSLAWLVAPVLFFSLSGSKLPGYVLPALPGATLLAGELLARFVRTGEGLKTMRATGALLLLCALALPVYAWRSGYATIACALFVAAPLLLASVFAIFWTSSRERTAASIVFAVFVSTALALGCLIERGAQRKSMRDLFQLASARGYAAAPVFNLHTIERTSEFYAGGRVVYDAQGEPLKFEGPAQVENAAREEDRPILVIVPARYAYQLTDDPVLETETIGQNGSVALIAVKRK
ncbi:MAG TPA: glycosyltransferase family 39 protein [Pyrinomonadaceae bacterium]